MLSAMSRKNTLYRNVLKSDLKGGMGYGGSREKVLFYKVDSKGVTYILRDASN